MRLTARRILLSLATIAAASILAIWLGGAALTGWLAGVAARNAGLEDADIRVASIGLTQLRAAFIGFRIETDRGPVAVRLQDAVINYDLMAQRMGDLAARAGSLDWQPPAVPTPAPTEAIPAPVLPLINARVDAFDLRLNFPPGPVTLSGPLHLALDPRSGVRATLAAPGALLTLLFGADGQQLDLSLTASSDESLAHLVVTDPLGLATRVALDADAARLLAWAGAGETLPPAWRELLVPVTLETGSIRAALQYLLATDAWRIDDLDAQWQGLRAPPWQASGSIKLSAEPEPPNWRVRLRAPGRVEIVQFDTDDPLTARIELADGLAIHTDPAGAVHGQGDARLALTGGGLPAIGLTLDRWMAGASAASAHAREMSLEKPTLRAADLQIDATPGAGGWAGKDAHGQLTLAGVHPDISAITPELVVNATWRLRGAERLDAELTSQLDGQPAARASLDWEPASAQGGLQADWAVEIGSLVAWARALYPVLAPVGAERGRLSGDARVRWQAGKPRGTLTARIAGLDGRYEEAHLEAADLDLRVTDLARPAASLELRVPTAEAATGLPINKLSLSARLDGDRLTVRDGGFEVWDGSVRIVPGALDLKKPGRLALQVSNLNLERALQFIDVTGLSGTGTLSGTVPLSIRPGGVAIEKASLTSAAPGTLRYVSAAPAAADNIALQALSDFRYQSLTAGLGYDPDGRYTIATRLRGSNPTLYSGYPIAFNINLQGQLPGLLRSALLTGDFNREVLKQVELEAGSPAPVPDGRPPAPAR